MKTINVDDFIPVKFESNKLVVAFVLNINILAVMPLILPVIGYQRYVDAILADKRKRR